MDNAIVQLKAELYDLHKLNNEQVVTIDKFSQFCNELIETLGVGGVDGNLDTVAVITEIKRLKQLEQDNTEDSSDVLLVEQE